MKKLIFAGVVVLSTFVFTACGDNKAGGESADSTATTTEETMTTDTTSTMGTEGAAMDSASTTPADSAR